jgi:hypothetical protein
MLMNYRYLTSKKIQKDCPTIRWMSSGAYHTSIIYGKRDPAGPIRWPFYLDDDTTDG